MLNGNRWDAAGDRMGERSVSQVPRHSNSPFLRHRPDSSQEQFRLFLGRGRQDRVSVQHKGFEDIIQGIRVNVIIRNCITRNEASFPLEIGT
jgi:hypothetical protein